MPSKNEQLDGIFAFKLSKDMYVSESSGKIHRNPEEGRLHLPVNSIIAINVPLTEQWSGVKISSKQFYRLTSENKIRLHRHYREGLIEIEDYDIIVGYPPTKDENAIKNNMIRKFNHFLIWLGEKEATKINAHKNAMIAESTTSIPSLQDIKKHLTEENMSELDEEYENIKCNVCQGKCLIYNIETHCYEDCVACKSISENNGEDDISDDCSF